MDNISVEDVSTAITGLDIAVLAFYFLIVIAIGVVVARKTEDGEDLFLAGRTLTWGVVGFSLFCLEHLVHNAHRAHRRGLHHRHRCLGL